MPFSFATSASALAFDLNDSTCTYQPAVCGAVDLVVVGAGAAGAGGVTAAADAAGFGVMGGGVAGVAAGSLAGAGGGVDFDDGGGTAAAADWALASAGLDAAAANPCSVFGNDSESEEAEVPGGAAIGASVVADKSTGGGGAVAPFAPRPTETPRRKATTSTTTDAMNRKASCFPLS